jgi:carbon monoxide dehydrogenase subunit G
VQLSVIEKLQLEAPPEEVWRLFRDTPRLAGLLPGVESVSPLAGAAAEAYEAKVTQKVGPFKVSMRLELEVIELVEQQLLRATVKGGDSLGMNRVTGTIAVRLTAEGSGTQMAFETAVEVLGKMAALGAPVVRRKSTELFSEFARKIQAEFAKGNA